MIEPTWQSKDGNVQLYLADCQVVLPLLSAGGVDSIITDPPYGIDYQSARRIDKTTWKPKLHGDTKPCLDWIPIAVPLLKDSGCCLCFCRWDVEYAFRDALAAGGLTIKSQVIWDRKVHGMGDLEGAFAPQHDNAIFATKNGFVFPGKRPWDVIGVARIPAEALVHPTEKPLPLLSYLVRHLTKIGDLVLDPFMGSGVTGAACAYLNRRFVGIEISPEYFEISCKRIQEAQMQLKLDFEDKV